MSGFSLLCCVVNAGNAEKTIKYAKKYGVKGGIVLMGRGIAQNHILQVLGLSEVRKEVVKMVIPDELAPEALRGISQDMQLHKPNQGIAFSMPIRAFYGKSWYDTEHNLETPEVKDKMYNIIYVIVNKGNADEVIEAANAAGARGATILNARGAGIGETQTFFKMQVVPEKEELFIITKTESKDAIIEAIRKCAKIDEPNNGILFVMDINEVYGLR